MGTNFYRIPNEDELESRHKALLSSVANLDLSASNVASGFAHPVGEDDWTSLTPWDIFTDDLRVHLGKRSGGWRFTWNFHRGKHYGTREELFAFIRSGRVVDEYGTQYEPEEFIQMALNWCPDGHVFDRNYVLNHEPGCSILYDQSHYSRIVEDLVISGSTEFS